MNPGEHIPKDFKPPHNILFKEISRLDQVVKIVEDSRKKETSRRKNSALSAA
jgi:hypothetical protein